MTTSPSEPNLDELLGTGIRRGLSAAELVRLLLEYRDGETVGEALDRVDPPPVEQMSWAFAA